MDLYDISGDHEKHEWARITWRLDSTGEHIVVCLAKTHMSDSAGEITNDPPLMDRLIKTFLEWNTPDAEILEDFQRQEALRDEAFDVMFEAADTIISDTEVAAQDPNRERTVHTQLYPKVSYHRLQVPSLTSSTPVLVPISAQEAAHTVSLEDRQAFTDYRANIQFLSSIPRFSTHRVRVVQEICTAFDRIYVVSVDDHGEDLFLCKAKYDGLRNPRLEREIDCLQRVLVATSSSADNDTSSLACRVPMLKGYVVHPANGAVLGFLREWVPSKGILKDFVANSDKERHIMGASMQMRRKWAGQIEQTLRDLHGIGVVWGNVKPSNLVLDESGDVHLIDFGGSFTRGWVDEALKETVEGDKQGLQRILKFWDIDDADRCEAQLRRLKL